MNSSRPRSDLATAAPPDWLNRCTLELTFRTLRHSAPGAALAVRNLLTQPQASEQGLYRLGELPLSLGQLLAVVAGLDRHCRRLRADQYAERNLASSLLLDWRMVLNRQRGETTPPTSPD